MVLPTEEQDEDFCESERLRHLRHLANVLCTVAAGNNASSCNVEYLRPACASAKHRSTSFCLPTSDLTRLSSCRRLLNQVTQVSSNRRSASYCHAERRQCGFSGSSRCSTVGSRGWKAAQLVPSTDVETTDSSASRRRSSCNWLGSSPVASGLLNSDSVQLQQLWQQLRVCLLSGNTHRRLTHWDDTLILRLCPDVPVELLSATLRDSVLITAIQPTGIFPHLLPLDFSSKHSTSRHHIAAVPLSPSSLSSHSLALESDDSRRLCRLEYWFVHDFLWFLFLLHLRHLTVFLQELRLRLLHTVQDNTSILGKESLFRSLLATIRRIERLPAGLLPHYIPLQRYSSKILFSMFHTDCTATHLRLNKLSPFAQALPVSSRLRTQGPVEASLTSLQQYNRGCMSAFDSSAQPISDFSLTPATLRQHGASSEAVMDTELADVLLGSLFSKTDHKEAPGAIDRRLSSSEAPDSRGALPSCSQQTSVPSYCTLVAASCRSSGASIAESSPPMSIDRKLLEGCRSDEAGGKKKDDLDQNPTFEPRLDHSDIQLLKQKDRNRSTAIPSEEIPPECTNLFGTKANSANTPLSADPQSSAVRTFVANDCSTDSASTLASLSSVTCLAEATPLPCSKGFSKHKPFQAIQSPTVRSFSACLAGDSGGRSLPELSTSWRASGTGSKAPESPNSSRSPHNPPSSSSPSRSSSWGQSPQQRIVFAHPYPYEMSVANDRHSSVVCRDRNKPDEVKRFFSLTESDVREANERAEAGRRQSQRKRGGGSARVCLPNHIGEEIVTDTHKLEESVSALDDPQAEGTGCESVCEDRTNEAIPLVLAETPELHEDPEVPDPVLSCELHSSRAFSLGNQGLPERSDDELVSTGGKRTCESPPECDKRQWVGETSLSESKWTDGANPLTDAVPMTISLKAAVKTEAFDLSTELPISSSASVVGSFLATGSPTSVLGAIRGLRYSRFISPAVLQNPKALLLKQHSICRSCGARLEDSMWNAARYCHYTGWYFCGQCHRSEKALVPARAIALWDFQRYPVCHSAFLFLRKTEMLPLVHLRCVSLSSPLFCHPTFLQIHFHRMQLAYVHALLRAFHCPLLQTFTERDLPTLDPVHFQNEVGRYSMKDLIYINARQQRIPGDTIAGVPGTWRCHDTAGRSRFFSRDCLSETRDDLRCYVAPEDCMGGMLNIHPEAMETHRLVLLATTGRKTPHGLRNNTSIISQGRSSVEGGTSSSSSSSDRTVASGGVLRTLSLSHRTLLPVSPTLELELSPLLPTCVNFVKSILPEASRVGLSAVASLLPNSLEATVSRSSSKDTASAEGAEHESLRTENAASSSSTIESLLPASADSSAQNLVESRCLSVENHPFSGATPSSSIHHRIFRWPSEAFTSFTTRSQFLRSSMSPSGSSSSSSAQGVRSEDSARTRRGSIIQHLSSLSSFYLLHLPFCASCSAAGAACAVCGQGERLFPLGPTASQFFRCSKCQTIQHRSCAQRSAQCPICFGRSKTSLL